MVNVSFVTLTVHEDIKTEPSLKRFLSILCWHSVRSDMCFARCQGFAFVCGHQARAPAAHAGWVRLECRAEHVPWIPVLGCLHSSCWIPVLGCLHGSRTLGATAESLPAPCPAVLAPWLWPWHKPICCCWGL